MVLKVLILGGTSEAFALTGRLTGDPRLELTYSLAGRTAKPRLPQVPTRIGGFGGIEGLTAFLLQHEINVLIDATHPFAEQISANAQAAAAMASVPLIALERAAWQPMAGDDWQLVPNLTAAAAALPSTSERIFLTVGRQSLLPFAAKPHHHYVIRVIDPPDIPPEMQNVDILKRRGPFNVDHETSLLREHRIVRLVSKNSGGKAGSAKLVAARSLRLPVLLVDRPVHPGVNTLESVGAVVNRLAHYHASLANRSE